MRRNRPGQENPDRNIRKIMNIHGENSLYRPIPDYAETHHMTAKEIVLQRPEEIQLRPEEK